jgi:hypothetical protein
MKTKTTSLGKTTASGRAKKSVRKAGTTAKKSASKKINRTIDSMVKKATKTIDRTAKKIKKAKTKTCATKVRKVKSTATAKQLQALKKARAVRKAKLTGLKGTAFSTTEKNSDGTFKLQKDFVYQGHKFSVISVGKGSTAHSKHIASGLINGVMRNFSSTTRKQAKDMFKKAIRKAKLTGLTGAKNTHKENSIKSLHEINSKLQFQLTNVSTFLAKTDLKKLQNAEKNIREVIYNNK